MRRIATAPRGGHRRTELIFHRNRIAGHRIARRSTPLDELIVIPERIETAEEIWHELVDRITRRDRIRGHVL